MSLLDKLLDKQDELAAGIVKTKTEGKKPKEPDVEEKEPDAKLIKTLTEEEKTSEGKKPNEPDVEEKEPDAKLIKTLTEEEKKEGKKPKEPDVAEKEPGTAEIKKLTEQPEDFRDVRDDEDVIGDDEEFRDEEPGDRDVEPEAAIEESPFPEKEYFGQDTEKELHYYLIGIKSEEGDVREDVQIQDQEENLLWSAKEKGIDISDVAMTIVEITKELEADVNYDVFLKYILPKLEEEPEEEEFEEEENFGEDEFGREGEREREKETPFESKKKVSEKSPPTCSKCNKAHWPFQKCDSGGEEKKEEPEEKDESIMKTNVTFNEQKFEVIGVDNNIMINGRKYPLSEDTLKFYHLKEEEDLKCLANDMLRAMKPEEIKSLTEKEGDSSLPKEEHTCRSCGKYVKDNTDLSVDHNCRKCQKRIDSESKESIMKTDDKEKDEKKVNEDLAADVKALQNDALAAIKEGDYIKAADMVSRLSAAQGAIGDVAEDTEAPVEEPEIEAEADAADTDLEPAPDDMEEKSEEKEDGKEEVAEEKIEEMTIQEAEELMKKIGLTRDADATDEQVIETAKKLKDVMPALEEEKDEKAEEKVEEKEEEKSEEDTDVAVGPEEKKIMDNIFESSRPAKEAKEENREEDR